MSHDATNWAIQQRGIKPALKVVLWHLCDRYNPDNGCFPSQETLAFDAEVSRSALNTYLDELEERGLIAREQRREKGSNKQERTRYRLAFEKDFVAKKPQNPCPDSGHGDDEAVSENAAEPSPENGESRVQNLDSNPVREPVNEPVREREARERDRSGSIVNADLIKRVQKFCTGDGYREGEWKKWSSSTIGHIAKQFAQLTAQEQQLACEWRDAFLAKCKRDRVTRPMPVANYFRDKIWEMLGEADKAAVRPVAGGAPAVAGGKVAVPVFGPAFAAARTWALLQGPVYFELPDDLRDKVASTYEVYARASATAALNYRRKLGLMLSEDGELIFPDDFEAREWERRKIDEGYPEAARLHAAAKDRNHVTVEPAFERLKEFCEPVPVGSDMWERWRTYHEDQGLPFVPTPAVMKVVFFPKGGPDGLSAFERAASAVMSMERGDDDAIQEG
ncbi:helix-turn-helix domain-containing protein [Shinella sp.]|uniref:helix-turn-helix domain-containing protein n=1 Tax=Shinella sp. TaxID=1870904 RepID=UPI0039E29ACB